MICLSVNACLLLCDCCHGEQCGSDFSMGVTLTIGVGSTPPFVAIDFCGNWRGFDSTFCYRFLFLSVNGKTVIFELVVADMVCYIGGWGRSRGTFVT